MYRLALVENSQRGRKKQIGSLIRMPDGRLGTFVGYCPNQACIGKICMDFTDAKDFTKRYTHVKKKLLNRVLLRLLQRLETA